MPSLSSTSPTTPSPGHSQGRGYSYPFADPTPTSTGGPTRTTTRRLMMEKERYDHEDDYDSDDDVYVIEGELEGEEEAASVVGSSEQYAQNPGGSVHDAEYRSSDEVCERQGEEQYILPHRGRESSCDSQSQRHQLSPETEESQGPQKSQEEQHSTPYYWQCHLCAYMNPIFPSSPHTSTDPFIDYPQVQQQWQNPYQYNPSFSSLPLSITQPCGNKNVLPRAPSTTLEYIEAPEKGSWERRVRDAAAAALATNANTASMAGTGPAASVAQPGTWSSGMTTTMSGNTNVNMVTSPGVRMPGFGPGRGITDRVMPPSPLRMTAFSSQSLDDDHGTGNESTPLLNALGTGTISNPGYEPAQAGINYASIPLSYAFSTADSSRSGPSVPVRVPPTAQGAAIRAWPRLGSVVEPRVGFGSMLGHGRGGGAWMPVGSPMPLEDGRSLHPYPQRIATTNENTTVTGDIAGSGSVFGAGIGDRCWHSRCEGCYDLNAAKRVLGFCAGSKVNGKLYEAWHQSFGSGMGSEMGFADAEEESNELDVMELTRDKCASRIQTRMRSPVRYSTGESRILLVQNAHSSKEEEDEDEGNDGNDAGSSNNSAKPSSDGGVGVFGQVGSDDNSGGESDGSDGSDQSRGPPHSV